MAVLRLVRENLVDDHFERPGAQHAEEAGENNRRGRESKLPPERLKERKKMVNPRPHRHSYLGKPGGHDWCILPSQAACCGEVAQTRVLCRSSGSTQAMTGSAL